MQRSLNAESSNCTVIRKTIFEMLKTRPTDDYGEFGFAPTIRALTTGRARTTARVAVQLDLKTDNTGEHYWSPYALRILSTGRPPVGIIIRF